MNKKKTSQKTLTLSILTFLTVLIWVSLDIYRAFTKTTLKPDVREELVPFYPRLDIEILESLEAKREIPFEEIGTKAEEATESEEETEEMEGAIIPEQEETETGYRAVPSEEAAETGYRTVAGEATVGGTLPNKGLPNH